jgi:NADH-ubiquinone oxidoreductase chain 5
MHEILLNTEFALPTIFKLLPLICTIVFTIIALIYSEFLPENVLGFKLSRLGYNIYGFFNQRFLVEFFYNNYITSLILDLGGQTTKILDKGSIEVLGPVGIQRELMKLSKRLVSLNTSVVTNYGLYIAISFILIVLITYLDLLLGVSLILLLSLVLIIATDN